MAKLSTAQRSKIAKAAWRKRQRSTPAKRKSTTPARRRKYTRRKGGMGELVTAAQASGGVNTIGLGALGGALASIGEKLLKPTMPAKQKSLWMVAGAFGIATLGKAPYMAAGVAGVAAYQLMGEVGLSEGEVNYVEPIEQLPEVLDTDGQPMRLSEDPTTGGIYLEEDDTLYLDEDGNELSYQVPYATDFAGDWQDNEMAGGIQ